eukprot:29081-Pelagococcus_subviridis.AAC.6
MYPSSPLATTEAEEDAASEREATYRTTLDVPQRAHRTLATARRLVSARSRRRRRATHGTARLNLIRTPRRIGLRTRTRRTPARRSRAPRVAARACSAARRTSRSRRRARPSPRAAPSA